jgi:hypothetical protein
MDKDKYPTKGHQQLLCERLNTNGYSLTSQMSSLPKATKCVIMVKFVKMFGKPTIDQGKSIYCQTPQKGHASSSNSERHRTSKEENP